MTHEEYEKERSAGQPVGGLAGWLLGRLRATRRLQPRLALLERIALAPRHSLALVEADGRRFLVATSPDGASVLYPLDGQENSSKSGRKPGMGHSGLRVSW